MKKTTFFLYLLIFSTVSAIGKTTNPIVISPKKGDMTAIIAKTLEEVQTEDIHLIFEKGVYRFKPDYARGKYMDITNHGNGYKRIIFDFSKFRSVIIEGNGAEFVFHGQLMPFLFENSKNIKVSNLTLDWDIPFTFLGEVVAVNEKEGWRDIKPFHEGFSWKVKNGFLEFPNIDDFSYEYPGSTLAFDPIEKRPVHGTWDINSKPEKVEKLPGGILRFHEKLNYYPPIGSLLSSKGDREHDRYAPAFDFKKCNNIELDNIVIHHALGMGFLFERSENIKLGNSGIYLREGTNRVISTTADATHFANCKGAILIESCRFENMLDDGTNVHGTYVELDEVIDQKTLRVKLGHFEQRGFDFVIPGDEVWFIKQPSPERRETAVVSLVKTVNDEYLEVHFVSDVPIDLQPGDILENKTWNPTFTMRGCIIKNHRARNVVLKTPLATVIEDNYFSSMMSSIFFRGETFFWYESGAVEDVLIQNNIFEYCAYSGMEHAVLNITPRLSNAFDTTTVYDKNIRFINNTIHTFDNRIVSADRVDGLVIKNNTILKTGGIEELYPEAPLIELINCQNTKIKDNFYEGDCKVAIKADEHSLQTLLTKDNEGFDSIKNKNSNKP
ncbi:right-handed parallel beta-helix repeat-containing protein [Leeuwenhoekiella parthenopeia]|uniref:Right-handed parallel beta-helix repeat-containing protein n=1 Tax=Leeuwenhoekiella parthenopeia TaxID=2890320 RepID=A0ABS8GPS6_9FLAO|nr:right-handed parallel beta-helix repeat-containing protein [Leeuwenhoekiella parthenopeia]MCC4211999.1 right-handed parallel beta-helix repeat-containing protein [Leeuwenhoekiella parthenopeia]